MVSEPSEEVPATVPPEPEGIQNMSQTSKKSDKETIILP
jgi:hypothetical protein